MSIVINGKSYESALHKGEDWNYGMYHMTSHPELYEPQRTNDFEFVVTNIDNIPDLITGQPIANAQEVIRLAVVSVDVPHVDIEALEERRGNSVQKFAGKASYSEGTLKVRDWIGANSKQILMSWQNCAYDRNTDKTGILSDYKKDCYLIEYTPDKREVRKWIMRGCWVNKISEDTFDHTNSAERQITATIQYDRADPLMPDN